MSMTTAKRIRQSQADAAASRARKLALEAERAYIGGYVICAGVRQDDIEQNAVNTARRLGVSYLDVLLACWRHYRHVSAVQSLMFAALGNGYSPLADKQCRTSPEVHG